MKSVKPTKFEKSFPLQFLYDKRFRNVGHTKLATEHRNLYGDRGKNCTETCTIGNLQKLAEHKLQFHDNLSARFTMASGAAGGRGGGGAADGGGGGGGKASLGGIGAKGLFRVLCVSRVYAARKRRVRCAAAGMTHEEKLRRGRAMLAAHRARCAGVRGRRRARASWSCVFGRVLYRAMRSCRVRCPVFSADYFSVPVRREAQEGRGRRHHSRVSYAYPQSRNG